MTSRGEKRCLEAIESLFHKCVEGNEEATEELARLLYAHAEALGHEGRALLAELPQRLHQAHPLVAVAEGYRLFRLARYREALLLTRELIAWRAGRTQPQRYLCAGPLPDDFDFRLRALQVGCAYHLGCHAEAIDLAEGYLATTALPRPQEQQIRFMAFVARCFVQRDETTLRAGRQLLALADDNPGMQAKVHLWLASIHVDLCQFVRGRDRLSEARALLARHEIPGGAGLRAQSHVIWAETLLWEGDPAGALRESEAALGLASAAEGFYRVQASLRHVEILYLLGRAAEGIEWLAGMEESLSCHHEIKRDALWALCHAQLGERGKAVQRLGSASARLRMYEEMAPADFDLPLQLAEAALEIGAPGLEELLEQAEAAVPPQFRGYQARVAWLRSRAAFAGGEPLGPHLHRFLMLCEQQGLAGLLHVAALKMPALFLWGMQEGIASPLYLAALPELNDAQQTQVAGLLAAGAVPVAVQRIALSLLARRPEHPATVQAAQVAATASDQGLRTAALRLLEQARSQTMAALEVRTFGGFDALLRGVSLSRGWRRKTQVMFVMLLLQSPRPLSRQLLAETLWPDLRATAAANNLRVAVHELKQGLASAGLGEMGKSSWVQSDADTIRLLQTDRIFWDARHLQRLAEVAHRCVSEGQDAVAITALRSIVDLYRGPLLPDRAFDGYFEMERRHYAHLAHESMTELAAFSLDQSQLEYALAAAQAAIRVEPLDELGHVLMMRVHAAMGFPSRVLETYRRYETLLLQETGDGPSRDAQLWLQRLVSTG